MAEWYHSRTSGTSALPEVCNTSRLQIGGFGKARDAGKFVGQGGTHKHTILKFVVGSFGLDSVLKLLGAVFWVSVKGCGSKYAKSYKEFPTAYLRQFSN